MTYFDRRHPSKRKTSDHREQRSRSKGTSHVAESTGSESAMLRSLVESGALVTVVLISGERLRCRIRYQDRDLFSIKLADGGPNLLVRKSSVLKILDQ